MKKKTGEFYAAKIVSCFEKADLYKFKYFIYENNNGDDNTTSPRQ
jgi:hypothetical protein